MTFDPLNPPADKMAIAVEIANEIFEDTGEAIPAWKILFGLPGAMVPPAW